MKRPSTPALRVLIALLFILHGLAHSAIGMWASDIGPLWLATPLWWLAEVGFLVAGLGLLGVAWCRRVWEPAAIIAALGSILLFDFFGHLALMLGLVLDTVLVVLGLRWGESTLLADVRGAPSRMSPAAPGTPRHPRAGRVASAVATLCVVYVALVIPLRPVFVHWGTSASDRLMPLPGDDQVEVAHYRIDHAVTIHAPADSVWPWLVQIGQDRAGFYSYDRLERLLGAQIHNADSVHPEWQVRQAGDLVRSVPPGYLGGRLGAAGGWRVRDIEPNRALVLENWGAFVLRPVDAHTTRLYVRTRGEGTPSLQNTLLSPLTVLVFEPIHFAMERRMLLGIKERAERRA